MKRREFLRKTTFGVVGGTATATLGACTTGVPTTGGQASIAAATTAASAAAVSAPASTAAVASEAASAPAATTAASASAAASEAAGAQAPMQNTDMPTLEWRMATSWPVALDTIFGGAQTVADRVSAMSEGRFTIRPFAGGELVPALQVLDAVQAGTAEMGHTASYYYVGKSPVFAFGTSLPFGLNAQQQNSWLYYGGGLEKLQEFYTQYNMIQFPAGNTGVQMGGWFRREINSLADLQGLKMRIPGLGGQVMAKLGVSVQTLAGGEIYQALETGAIDATEWVGPYDDQKLGLNKVAQLYYAPGWWEPGPSLEVQVNLQKWNELPRCIRSSSSRPPIRLIWTCWPVMTPRTARRCSSWWTAEHSCVPIHRTLWRPPSASRWLCTTASRPRTPRSKRSTTSGSRSAIRCSVGIRPTRSCTARLCIV